MRRKAVSLIVANLALASGVGLLAVGAGTPIGTPATIVVFAAVFAAVSLFSARLEFRRQQVTFTLAEAVFVIALFHLGPVGAGLAGALGELALWRLQRLRGLKAAFNASNQLQAMTIAAAGFRLIGWTDPAEPGAWFAALGAAVCFSLLNLAFLTTVLAVAEERRFRDLFFESATTGVLMAVASAPLGILALDLFEHAAIGPMLLVPIVVAVALNSRHATAQRDEHLRFERLYASSSRMGRLVDFDEALAVVAREAKELVTGAWAVCVAEAVDGQWVGACAGPDGAAPLPSELVASVRELATGQSVREVQLDALPGKLRSTLPPAVSAVVASSGEGSAASVTLAVFRDSVSAEDTPESRIATMAAFVAHATMAIGNARLLGEVEEALRQQVDLNRQKGDFVAAVSHELRTPLTAMIGSIGTMMRLEQRLDGDDRRRLLRIGADQGDRLQRLIEELLTVASAEQPGMHVRHEVLHLGQLMDGVRGQLNPVTAARVVLDEQSRTGSLVSDVLKVEQIVLNLVENAGKYAPQGPIEVTTRDEGGEMHISVRDHGPGIAPGDRDRVFERFVQLDQSSTRSNGGTGLGLYLCRQLAHALGGSLVLDEVDTGGCQFVLRLPMGDPAAVDPAAEPPQLREGAKFMRRPKAMSRAGDAVGSKRRPELTLAPDHDNRRNDERTHSALPGSR